MYLGYHWLEAGIEKLGDSRWMSTGEAVKSFWERAITVPPPPARPPVAYDWYRDFLRFMLDHGYYTWFGKLVALGETLVGIALVLGALTAIAATVGAFMNMNFMLAGTASTNPVLLLVAIFLILAWRVAGYWGVDGVLSRTMGALPKPMTFPRVAGVHFRLRG